MVRLHPARWAALLAILLFASPHLDAQLPPVGAFWNFNASAHNGGASGKETFMVDGDTLIDGILHMSILRRVAHVGILPFCSSYYSESWFGYLYQRGDSVFYKNSWQDEFLYRYDMAVGDTLRNFFIPPHLDYVVDSLGELVIGSDTLRQAYLAIWCDDDPTGFTETITERIGPSTTFHFDYDGPCLMLAGCAMTRGFRCYNEGALYYPEDCAPAVTPVREIDDEVSDVYYDPARRAFILEGSLVDIDGILISDLAGRVWQREAPARVVPLRAGRGGLYVFTVFSGRGTPYSKLVPIQ